jgi:tellurium resistance protein TerD|tara:strand:- start:711 stop:1289 length:579 start_codon:yes stop_codon:yes gene_type:complete
MGVSLSKGGNVSLEKAAPGMIQMIVGLGWDTRSTDGEDFDLDASVFLLGANGKVIDDKSFIFYNNLKSVCGSIEHTGDNLTGEGEGDDESIKINLTAVPASVNKIAISVTIHDAESRGQNFGQVSNAFVRVVDEANGEEVIRYDLSEDYSIETAMNFSEIYRHNGEWKFKAIGQGFAGGLEPMAKEFGVNLA